MEGLQDNSFSVKDHIINTVGKNKNVPISYEGYLQVYVDHRDGVPLDRSNSGGVIRRRSSSNYAASFWLYSYCIVKSNFLFYFELSESDNPNGVLSLESAVATIISSTAEGTNQQLPALPNTYSHGTKKPPSLFRVDFTTTSGVSPRDSSIYFIATSLASAQHWCKVIERSSFTHLHRLLLKAEKQLEKANRAGEQSARLVALKTREKETEVKSILAKHETFNRNFEELLEENFRLKKSGELTEKAAAEFANQKANESAYLQQQLASGLAEIERLSLVSRESKEKLSEARRSLQAAEQKQASLRWQVDEMVRDLQESMEAPARITLRMMQTKERNQLLFLEKKNLKREVKELTENFHAMKETMSAKVQTLREIAEAGDIFEYLKKRIFCSEQKIRYLENAYKLSETEERELKKTVVRLQKETKIAEAAARASYVAHRTRILGEQLSCLAGAAPPSEYYEFAKATLERFAWILGEAEPIDASVHKGDATTLWGEQGSFDALAPLKEKIFFSGGFEGGHKWKLVTDVDILAPVEKRVPVLEYEKLKNMYEELLIQQAN